jgi:hypothetical protein
MANCRYCWRHAMYARPIPDGKWWWQKGRHEYYCSGHSNRGDINMRTGKKTVHIGKFFKA